jgi:putative ABC transport system permease protein
VRPLLNAARTGFAEIWSHKTRSALSFLAIAVGSVVFIDSFAAIVETQRRLSEQERVSGVARMKVMQNSGRSYSNPDNYVPTPVIRVEDVAKLRERVPGLFMVSPEARDWRNVFEYEGKRVVTSVYGVTPEWTKRDFVYTLHGRFIDQQDVDGRARVAVVVRKAPPSPASRFEKAQRKRWDYTSGFDVLVSHADLLGKQVRLDNKAFTVVGVLEEPPASRRPATVWGGARDQQVLAPVTTLYQAGIINEWQSLELNIDTGDERTFDDSMRRVKDWLKARFGDEDAFIIENQREQIKDRIDSSLKAALMTISLGMLAFIAGGIGIMNVTLATVFSRTTEIGIRRAVGAGRGDIMLQFVVEAVMLGLIGGVLGSAAGWLWGVPGKVLLGMDRSPIQPWMPLVSVLIAALTAFAFSLYPAWVAAGLKPADALRAD